MKTLQISIIIISLVVLGMTGIAFGQNVYTQQSLIWTDKPNYAANDTITISGYLDKAKIKYIHTLDISINNPNGELYKEDSFLIGQDGRFNYQFKILGDLATTGMYVIRVRSFEGPGLDLGTSFHADAAPNSLVSNLDLTQGFVDLAYSSNNMTETVQYYITVEPKSKAPLVANVFKNGQILQTDTLSKNDAISFSTGIEYNYNLTISGNQDQDVYKVEFKSGDKSVEKIVPTTSTALGFVNNTSLDVLSPLKQLKTGTDPYHITCRQDLQLVVKLKNNSPACVRSTSLSRLLKQGWTSAPENGTNGSNSDFPTTYATTNMTQDNIHGIQAGLQLLLYVGSPTVHLGQPVVVDIILRNALFNTLVVPEKNNWAIQVSSLDPCVPNPVGLAIIQGYYTEKNMAEGKRLPFYNPNTSCPLVLYNFTDYQFAPLSSHAQVVGCSYQSTSSSVPVCNIQTSRHISVKGYLGERGTHNFDPGNYTVVGADEWGHVEIRHFLVTNSTTG